MSFAFGSAATAPPAGGHPVKWYYYLQNDPRRRLADGWYEYDNHINMTVEQLFQTSQTPAANTRFGGAGAGAGSGPANKRRHVLNMVASSGYQYELDFVRMTQRNMASGKERPIFRTANGQPPMAPPPPPAVAPAVVHATIPPPVPHVAAPAAPAASSFASGYFPSRRGGAGSSTTVLSGGILNYVAPELLHEIKLDEAKVFEDVAAPDTKPKAKNSSSSSSDEDEEKKNGDSSYTTANEDDDCAICLDALWTGSSTGGGGGGADRVVKIKNCGHRFHYQCIHEALTKMGGKCPLCAKSVAQEEDAQTSKGKCPSATMGVRTNGRQCAGFGNVGTIEISYRIPGGTQKAYHPQPGFGFSGANRNAYLPDNQEGRDLLARMQFAFMHGLSFMVGTSLTTGQANTVTWASIHHKTSMSGGTYGYPDATYFNRSNDELNQLGVPPPAACRTWLQNKCPGYDG